MLSPNMPSDWIGYKLKLYFEAFFSRGLSLRYAAYQILPDLAKPNQTPLDLTRRDQTRPEHIPTRPHHTLPDLTRAYRTLT